MKGRVLIIAGSDPSGGAGIQADIKTVTALGGYAATAITALTVQNTKGVQAVHPVSLDIIRAQIDAVMSDIGADSIKIGMIGDVATANMIGEFLASLDPDIDVVLDPVLAATSGDALASDGVAMVIRDDLMQRARVITPNSEELAVLSGQAVSNETEMVEAASVLISHGAPAVLAKGGHLGGREVTDVLVEPGERHRFSHPRIDTTSTHGTGCTLASAVATGLAQKLSLPAAVRAATDYVHKAIALAPGFGAGHGPLDHAHTTRPAQ